MKTNKLIVAAAGSGKTTYLINRAIELGDMSVLITTYTEANETEIKRNIIKKKGCIPPNIKIQTWFSFLLQHGLRPYQSVLDESIHNSNIGFFLSSEKSGKKYVTKSGIPVYWGEDVFREHYFTNRLAIYSDKLSKFVYKTNAKSNNLVIDRISRIFSHIMIDEVQDLAGYDLELIKLFFQSDSSILLVGDPRQVTYLTNHAAKFEKYSDGLIAEFIMNELGKEIHCDIDEDTLNVSHRNNQLICEYSAKLYPSLPVPAACNCRDCRSTQTDHEGVFLIKPNEVDKYLSTYKPMQLRWSSSVRSNPEFPVVNFGESKGLTFDRVLIYPTHDMAKWVKNNNIKLSPEARAKLYVGVTRARNSVSIIMDYSHDEKFEGITKYSC
jgi:DNA helicase II / ATP-dependent DNA helicase PcrA